MNNIYIDNYCKTISNIIIGPGNVKLFKYIFEQYIMTSIKKFKDFTIQILTELNMDDYLNYNYVYYVTNITYISKDDSILEQILNNWKYTHNHLFIIIDECNSLRINDDGDLSLSGDELNIINNFERKVSNILKEDSYHILKTSLQMINIIKQIINDSSIVNLTEDEINKLYNKLIKKSSTTNDKKKEIRHILKKIDLNNKLEEVGYIEMTEHITKYFKIIFQKKTVYSNYVYVFNKLDISLGMNSLKKLLKEIYEIDYLKEEIYSKLCNEINNLFLNKVKIFYKDCRKNFGLKNTLDNFSKRLKIDTYEQSKNYLDNIYEYHALLIEIINICKEYKISEIETITKQEIDMINNHIIDYHNKEVEKITDLDKIISFLEILSTKDKNNMFNVFDKIKTHPKIIIENLDKVDKWLIFIKRSLKLGIKNDNIIRLLEEIIIIKISHYISIEKTNNNNIFVLYPQCLQIFLLSNLNKNFIFKKLYMYTSYSIRYSGRNLSELIKNLKSEQFDNMLILENKLLELCTPKVSTNDIEIVETFNEINN